MQRMKEVNKMDGIRCDRCLMLYGDCICHKKEIEEKTIKDTEIVNWLCDHATFILVINYDGSDEVLKVAEGNLNLRAILVNKIRK